jgi:hypothetical protein
MIVYLLLFVQTTFVMQVKIIFTLKSEQKHKKLIFIDCQQNFKKLALRRNGLAEKLVSEREQKKTYQEQEEALWSEGELYH